MPRTKVDPKIKRSIGFPPPLLKRLQRQADAAGHSLSAWVVLRLEDVTQVPSGTQVEPKWNPQEAAPGGTEGFQVEPKWNPSGTQVEPAGGDYRGGGSSGCAAIPTATTTPPTEPPSAPRRSGRRQERPLPDFPAFLREQVPDITERWRERMKSATKKPSISAEEKQVARLNRICEEYGPDPVLKTIDEATLNGWQGIFPDRHLKAATRREDSEWGIFADLKRDMDERLS